MKSSPKDDLPSATWIRSIEKLTLAVNLLYTNISVFVAIRIVYEPPQPVIQTPAAFGLSFRNVNSSSHRDHLALQGWFIPGVLPDGHLTSERTLVLVHGLHSSRTWMKTKGIVSSRNNPPSNAQTLYFLEQFLYWFKTNQLSPRLEPV